MTEQTKVTYWERSNPISERLIDSIDYEQENVHRYEVRVNGEWVDAWEYNAKSSCCKAGL